MNCALCASTDGTTLYAVPTRGTEVGLCALCLPQVEGAELDPTHWHCLQEAAWSQDPPVQVLAYRLLRRLTSQTWASDLLDQLYLEDDVLAWAQEGANEERVRVVDSHGTELFDGDSVTLIKDLDVKGANFTAKRGTMVRGIRLGDDPTHVEGRVNKVAIYLKTEFLKRA